VTIQVEVLVPDRSLWSGTADQVIAKTLDGDIGVLGGHAPVFGVLVEGSLVRILGPSGGSDASGDSSGEVRAAVTGGFLSVTEEKVTVLAADALLGAEVDTTAAKQEEDTATAQEGPDSPEARYARARLRAAGEQA
jgi:F-type H+-transporting ATPase subunit epsilon